MIIHIISEYWDPIYTFINEGCSGSMAAAINAIDGGSVSRVCDAFSGYDSALQLNANLPLVSAMAMAAVAGFVAFAAECAAGIYIYIYIHTHRFRGSPEPSEPLASSIMSAFPLVEPLAWLRGPFSLRCPIPAEHKAKVPKVVRTNAFPFLAGRILTRRPGGESTYVAANVRVHFVAQYCSQYTGVAAVIVVLVVIECFYMSSASSELVSLTTTESSMEDLDTFGKVLDLNRDSAAAHAATDTVVDVNHMDFENKVKQDVAAFYWIVFTSATVCVMRLVSNLCVSGCIFRTLGCHCTM
jgi:hypothetical protein